MQLKHKERKGGRKKERKQTATDTDIHLLCSQLPIGRFSLQEK